MNGNVKYVENEVKSREKLEFKYNFLNLNSNATP
jgi:hypothetical protein